MDIDPVAYVGAVERELSFEEVDGQRSPVVTARRWYATSARDLWDALTNPERIPRWFMPVTGDLRVGGRYQLEGNAGGTVVSCDPPRAFTITWEFGGGTSHVDVQLQEALDGEQTKLVLVHRLGPPEAIWEEFGPGAVGDGWDLSLLGLELHLGSGEALDPAEVEAWSTSPQGKAFLRGATNGWRDAAVAAGLPEEGSSAAAERTFAFYTQAPEPEPGA